MAPFFEMTADFIIYILFQAENLSVEITQEISLFSVGF